MPDAAELITECINAFNDREFQRGIDLFAPDATQEDKAIGTKHIGPEGRRQIFEENFAQFSDAKTIITKMFPNGDSCAYLAVWSGTNDGPMTDADGKEHPPTNIHLEIEFMGLVESKDGLIAQSDKYYDSRLYDVLG